ncbi:GIP [Symbiodinium sp. CCMP2592]|nr:GIP [Symbiodinium sp. CCMP2592]
MQLKPCRIFVAIIYQVWFVNLEGDVNVGDLPVRFLDSISGKVEQFCDAIQHAKVDVTSDFFESKLVKECMTCNYKGLPEPFRLRQEPQVSYTMQLIILPATPPEGEDPNSKYVHILKHVYLQRNKINASEAIKMCYGISMRFEWGTHTRQALIGLTYMLDKMGDAGYRFNQFMEWTDNQIHAPGSPIENWSESFEKGTQLVSDALGGKALSTLQKRYGQLSKYVTWCNDTGCIGFPLSSDLVRQYTEFAVKTKGHGSVSSNLESFNFAIYVLGVFINEPLRSDPVLTGRARRERLNKPPRKQARSFLVAEVLHLEGFLASESNALLDRFAAGCMLFAIFSRARLGDLKSVSRFTLDLAEPSADCAEGFLECYSYSHKTKSLSNALGFRLPLVAHVKGLGPRIWGLDFLEVARQVDQDLLQKDDGSALLCVPTSVGSLLNHPIKNEAFVVWINGILKDLPFFGGHFTGHTAKSTLLPWLSKWGGSEDDRAILGHHMPKSKSVATYSRDLQAGPLRVLWSLLCDVRSGAFLPDCTRSGRFVRQVDDPGVEPALDALPGFSDGALSPDLYLGALGEVQEPVSLGSEVGPDEELAWYRNQELEDADVDAFINASRGSELEPRGLSDPPPETGASDDPHAEGAAFEELATECGLSSAQLLILKGKGVSTMSSLAYAVTTPGVQPTELALRQLLDTATPEAVSVGALSSIRRCVFECQTCVVQQLKLSVEGHEGDKKYDLPPAERTSRIAAQKTRLVGFELTGAMECAYSCYTLVGSMLEADSPIYLEPHRFITRQQEVCREKPKREIVLDGGTKLTVRDQQSRDRCQITNELQLWQALTRRSLACDLMGAISFQVQESWHRFLFDRMAQPPPPRCSKVSMEQLLRADRQAWVQLAETVKTLKRDSAGVLPLDAAFPGLRTDPAVLFNLLPLRSPDPPQKIPNPDKGNGKGLDKGIKRDSEGQPRKESQLPDALKNIPNLKKKTSKGKRLCWAYNIKDRGCSHAEAGKACRFGLHLCMRCEKPHPQFECPAASVDASAEVKHPAEEFSLGVLTSGSAGQSWTTGLYTKGGITALRSNVKSFPFSSSLLFAFIRTISPSFECTSAALFVDSQTALHRDSYNAHLPNLLIGVNSFSGGQLWLEGEGPHPVTDPSGAQLHGQLHEVASGKQPKGKRVPPLVSEYKSIITERTYGIAWTPEEFVKQESPADLARERTATLRRWMLTSEEAASRADPSDMPDHCAAVLGKKSMKVFKSLLTEAEYPDTTLTKVSAASLTVEDVRAATPLARKAILASTREGFDREESDIPPDAIAEEERDLAIWFERVRSESNPADAEPLTKYKPGIFDDGNLQRMDASFLKAFLNPSEEDATVWARYSSAYFEQGAGRQACNNPYNRQIDEEAHKNMKASNIWEIPHKQFLELIQPSFSSIDEAEDMDAILARTHVIVITDHGLYWRLAKVEKTNIRFVQWPSDEPRDLLVQSQKAIFVNYKKNPSKHQLPESFHEDMVWSQEVLHRLFEGETTPRTVTIRGVSLFGEPRPPRQIHPRIVDGIDLGVRVKKEKVDTAFRNLKRSAPITIDLASPEKKHPCTSGAISKDANDEEPDDLELQLEEMVDKQMAEEEHDAMDVEGGDCKQEVLHDVCGVQVLQWFGLPVQANTHGPFRVSELNGMITQFAVHFMPMSSVAVAADGMYLCHRDHHFTGLWCREGNVRYFDGGTLIDKDRVIPAILYTMSGPVEIAHRPKQCTSRSCRATYAYNFRWENSKKVNVLSLEDLDEKMLFVSSTKAFCLQYLRYHEELLFRGHVATRAIEHAYNVVFNKQDTQDDQNVVSDFRKLHQTCMFYHLALQEFQTLGLHKTLVIDDEFSDESLDVYSAFCHSSLYPPKKKTSVTCLVGDGYLSLKPRCAHAPKKHAGRPRSKKSVPSKYSNGWFMCCDPNSGRILSMVVMHEPECNEYVIQALESVLWLYPACKHFVYDRACTLVKMARKHKALDQIKDYIVDWFHAYRHAKSCTCNPRELVLNQLAAAVAQLAQATASSSAGSSQWKETKYVKAPDLFKGRPLKLLRANKNGDGYAVWRQLCDELQPRSRPRALALAQALSRFPPHKEGTSLLEYILSYERLIGEYEAVATEKYQEDLKISTLLAGLPAEVKRYMYLQVNDSTTYLGLREKLLQYERTSSTWTAESMLKSLGSGFNSDAMDIDRVADGKGKGKKGDKGAKGKGSKGDYNKKGDYGKKGNDKGWNRDGGKGYGKGPPKGGKGKKGDAGKKGFQKNLVECWKCGKKGHYAAECRSRVNQVNQEDDAASVQTRATTSSATTASTAAPSAKAQVRRVHVVDLEQLGEDQELAVEFLGSVRMVQEVDNEAGVELPCSSVQCFAIGGDSEVDQPLVVDFAADCTDEFHDGVAHVRVVAADPNLHEVILDSGADCTVLPLSSFSDVGHHSRESSFLLDAQGNRIPQGQVRTSVVFEVEGEDGEVIQFRDKAVLAQVRQPLFCFGKLLRDQWVPSWILSKAGDRKYEVFECCEVWEDRLEFGFGACESKVLTILTKEAIEPSDLGTVLQQVPNPLKPLTKQTPKHPRNHEVLGDDEEVLVVNGERLTELSPLRELRLGCRFLGISKNGSKSAVWQRLKKEVAHSKLQLEVAASEAVRAEFSRDPVMQARPVPPSPELVELHEVTHLPRADWCEACIAARSREDNYDAAGPKREFPVISLDFMFVKTDGEDAPLATHLVCVDSQSKYVVAVALAAKGGKTLKHAVEEVVGMLTVLGYAKVILRYDTEPAMKQLVSSIVAVRAKNNLATELLSWNQLDGCTSHELVHGRKYDQKLCPFGSAVYAQYLPKNKNKGETWCQGVWLGRSRIGNLHVIGDSSGVHFARTIRRPPKLYDVELLKTMKGTPYDFLLDVVPVRKKKIEKQRLPILVEAVAPAPSAPEAVASANPGDEAASDPASSEAGGVGSLSVSLPGQSSATNSSSSSEMIPEPMEVEGANQVVEELAEEVVSAEGGLPTGHFEEEGFNDVPQDWDEIFEETWQIEGVLQEAGRRKYEEGPPVLDDEALAALDAEMDEVEIQRLLGMKVLEEIGPDEDVSDMYRLGCKNVRDWRFRGGWTRRSRLVAKEFRFLQPYMENLYSPASLSSTQRLLAGLCCCNPQLRLYSGDIKDAYLTVKQRRKTYIVSSSGRMYRLHYNLPGQRAGARDWHEKLKAVLESDGLRAFEGAPALFYEPQSLLVSTHVDDLQQTSSFGVEGPCTPWSGECRFLKRKFAGINGSIVIEQDGKHVEKLISLVGVERESGKQTPCPMNPNDVKSVKPLAAEKHPTYRTCIGILLYLGPDRPECLYAIKLLSAKTSCPTEHEWHLLKHLVKYLKLHPHRGISLSACNPGRTVEQRWLGHPGPERGPDADASKPFGSGHLIESISDASWAGEADRRSISASVVYLNGNAIHVGNKRQKSISLSSCESEVHGSLYSIQEGLFLKRLLETVCDNSVHLVHRVDSSSCRSFIDRVGLGRLKHIDIAYLWVQDLKARNMFTLKPISTRFCPPDLATKPMSGLRSRMLSYLIGVCQSDGTLIGGEEFDDEWNREHLRRIRGTKEGVLAPSKAYVARRVLALLLASEGLSFADGASFLPRDPNIPFMMTFWRFGFMMVIPVVLAVLFVNTEAYFKGYYKSSGEPNVEEAIVDKLKVTRRLEETVEYHENTVETNFLENAFYIMAFFAGVIGWLAFQLGLRWSQHGEQHGEQHGQRRGDGLQAPLLHHDDPDVPPGDAPALPEQEDQGETLREGPPEVLQGAVRDPGVGAQGGDSPDEGGEQAAFDEAYEEETPRPVRLHRLFKSHGVEYSADLLWHWETHREVSEKFLAEFENRGTAASSAGDQVRGEPGAAAAARVRDEEVWLVGRGSAFHKESCGMVRKGRREGKTRTLSRETAVSQGYKSCGQCKP